VPSLILATQAHGSPLDAVREPLSGSVVEFAWLIPVVPALAAGFLLLFGKRLGRASAFVAIAAMGIAAVLSTLVFLALQAEPEGERTFVRTLGTWISAGDLRIDWALLIDPLSSVMLLLVTWVGLLIHIYSVGYMHGDERYPRFFAYLNLFAASMLILVLGESLATLFVGWELVGLCSYLLIGFWFERRDYASAAKKAFVLNRVGDVGFMLAMFLVFSAFGSLSLVEVLPEAGATLAAGTAVAVTLLLFLGATGKSAQIPLYVWLPDAMAGPTPVSALIHAATMVTAGVYLVARTSPFFSLVPEVGLVVAWVGAATALLAALIACAQNDIKRILAYSTVSQLGYMFIAVGVGDYTAGVFHLLTHGFFKALLFLAAGSVMHALANQTDVRAMGGLVRALPVTCATSLVGVLAISGLPPLSGYFSKEEVLASAAETAGGEIIWFIGVVVAGLTAFYMVRWFMLVFLGRPRWKDWEEFAAPPHESPVTMAAPLVLLAAAAAVGGLLNVNAETGFLHGWLEPSVVAFEPTSDLLFGVNLNLLAILAALAGVAAAINLFREPYNASVGETGGLAALARRRFYVDELYQWVVLWPGRILARFFVAFDTHVVDGTVNGLARATGGLATVGRRVQTGFVRSYALAVLTGTVLVTALFLSSYLATAGG